MRQMQLISFVLETIDSFWQNNMVRQGIPHINKSPETSCPHAARRLPANLYHPSPHPHHGTNSRPTLPLSSLPLSSSKPVVHRPVRFPSDWISNSCNNLSSQHRHQPTSNQPLCHRHIPGLQQGVWHSATLHPDGEDSPASPSRLRIQLAGWLLHRAFALYCLPWSSVDAEVHHCQHYQVSGIGPAAYVVNVSDLKAVYVVNVNDLKAVTPGYQLCKFADDTYLVISASNINSQATEIDDIETWARTNNLTLNQNKSKEIIFSDTRQRRSDWTTTANDGYCPCHVSQNYRRHNDKWTVRLSVWPCPWRHQTMRADHTRCSCARTACVTRRYRPSSGQSPSPSCSTHPVHGLDSPKRLTGSESMDSYDAASAVATVRQSFVHLPNSVRLWMNNYLITFVITRITYCSVQSPSQPSTALQNYHLRPRAHSQQLGTATYWTSDWLQFYNAHALYWYLLSLRTTPQTTM